MADISALEVIDTAVKIGLGAAIAGVSAILVARHNHSHELRALRFQRRLDAIEKVSDVADNHFAVLDAFLGTILVAYDHVQPSENAFTRDDRAFIEQADNRFMASMYHLKEAAARLRLLGEADAYSTLNRYMKAVAAFRNDLIVDGNTPTKSSYDDVSNNVASCKKQIYQALCACYGRLPT